MKIVLEYSKAVKKEVELREDVDFTGDVHPLEHGGLFIKQEMHEGEIMGYDIAYLLPALEDELDLIFMGTDYIYHSDLELDGTYGLGSLAPIYNYTEEEINNLEPVAKISMIINSIGFENISGYQMHLLSKSEVADDLVELGFIK